MRAIKAAYKQADGKKIDNKRVLVDVERGRTVPNWRPRRLGGGLGTSRFGYEEVNQKQLGRSNRVIHGETDCSISVTSKVHVGCKCFMAPTGRECLQFVGQFKANWPTKKSEMEKIERKG
ncbi:U1 small nuclear ribonucleoprotein 70 kDa [Striga asiatica]|uniref:U1 small nuclear ribonucleoprotein 70 kDa n=1 Tax=Striga asiatica TaxID=4170 RepID=A0A5A7QC44_STRAF|nr:U1 small nuclear ribonucleoprotein 70 kDa [Striga asiatica]